MASLRELRRQLKSVQMTGQMAGAMKTASSVKFTQISGTLTGFEPYAAVCRDMRRRFGASLSEAFPVKEPTAPRCFVFLGANRGLCGGYNIQLYEFADRLLAQAGDCCMIVSGRHAANHYTGPEAQNRTVRVLQEFTMPDIPSSDDASNLLRCALDLYEKGEVSTVELIWQRYVNVLTQEPDSLVILPLSEGARDQTRSHTPSAPGGSDNLLYLPDRDAVLQSAAGACVFADFYARVLEAAAGAQAATLVAMRTAFDNAEKSAAALEADISHRRQNEITSGVIETASGNAARRSE